MKSDFGEFPGVPVIIKPKEKTKKKNTYVIFCGECGYEMKVSKKVFEKHGGGLPTCACGAKMAVDAGADLVVGMHSHCMQGLEYYKGKLIVYSLGNFTFSRYTLTAGMLKTNISDEGEFTNTFYPLMHKDNFTYINSGESGESQFAELKGLLLNSDISDDYIVTEGIKKENEDE